MQWCGVSPPNDAFKILASWHTQEVTHLGECGHFTCYKKRTFSLATDRLLGRSLGHTRLSLKPAGSATYNAAPLTDRTISTGVEHCLRSIDAQWGLFGEIMPHE